MVSTYTPRFQRLLRAPLFALILVVSFLCPELWASQEALVVVDRAMIYADMEMTSPIGFVSRGKKVQVGEIPRNKAQVYPIIVSGKIAYIKVLDVSTEKESVDSKRLTAERFQKSVVEPTFNSRFSIDYVRFASRIRTEDLETEKYQHEDSINWNGLSVRGDVMFKTRLDAELVFNYLNSISGEEELNIFELGLGGGLRIIDSKRLIFKIKGEALGIPFASFNIDDDRINGWGYTFGGGADIGIILGDYWGIDLFGGVFYTKLKDINLPGERREFAPSFTGVRVGGGLTFKF